MKPQSLSIPQDELLRKLQSGELVVVSRENMEQINIRLADRSVVDIVQDRIDRALRGEDIGPTSGITYGQAMAPEPGLRINLGSGQRPFKSPWINVDIQPKWCPDVLADGATLKDHFQDNTAEMIVLQHTLEHYGCGEADAMLKECYRILRSGGSLIVTVPDMPALVGAWNPHGEWRPKEAPEMNTQLFMTNVYGAYHGDEADRHKWGYEEDSLRRSLVKAAPWKSVPLFDWREIPGADIARDWWILGMEAVK